MGLYDKTIPDMLSGCDSILDLGCGKDSVLKFVKARKKVGVDIYKPYIEISRMNGYHTEYILKDIRKVKFKDNSFDAVIALDVIEHLKFYDGLELIKKMKRWAKKVVIIFTPNGWLNQDEYDENVHQKHLSYWTREILSAHGFDVHGINGLRQLRGEKGRIINNPKIVWSLISKLSQPFVYNNPDYAFQLLAVIKYES